MQHFAPIVASTTNSLTVSKTALQMNLGLYSKTTTSNTVVTSPRNCQFWLSYFLHIGGAWVSDIMKFKIHSVPVQNAKVRAKCGLETRLVGLCALVERGRCDAEKP